MGEILQGEILGQEAAVIETKPLEASLVITKDGSKIPAYVWKTGTTFFLSKKEKIVADTYVRTQSWKECEKALKLECGIKRSAFTCKRWYEGKAHIKEYVNEQFEVLGVFGAWTKERWMKVMHDHLVGGDRLATGDLYGMKLIASVKGWDRDVEGMQIINQINFTQANGRG